MANSNVGSEPEVGLNVPILMPRTALVWSALVEVGERESLGASAHGMRWIVPILGGQFRGEPGFQNFSGLVRSGGADRQLLRSDGVKELRAEYEMETVDGAVITIRNDVIVDEQAQPSHYAMSRIRITAPQGDHDWMNRRLFIGTLQSLRPTRPAVVVRGYLVES